MDLGFDFSGSLDRSYGSYNGFLSLAGMENHADDTSLAVAPGRAGVYCCDGDLGWLWCSIQCASRDDRLRRLNRLVRVSRARGARQRRVSEILRDRWLCIWEH